MNEIELKTSGRFEALHEQVKEAKPVEFGNITFQYELRPLSESSRIKAKNELRENEENVKQALAELRELLKGEPDFHILDDDYFFAKFLRPCKWHAKPAFELIKRFYRYRLNYPRYCNNLTPLNEKVGFISDIVTPLPLRTEDGCRVLLIEGGKKWNPKKVTLNQYFRVVMMLLDAAILEPETQVNGVHVIIDMDGLALSQVTYYTPSFASAVLEWVQKCLPIRLKGVHIVNQPFIFNMVFAIFKPFFMEKLRKRVHFHGTNKESLIKYVGRRAIPTNLGGDCQLPEEPAAEKLWEYMCLFEEEFQAAEKLGYTKKQ